MSKGFLGHSAKASGFGDTGREMTT